MKPAPVLLLSALLLLCCHQRQPKMSDAQMQKILAAEPGLTEHCLDEIRWGGIESLKPNEDCSKRLPAKRWRGLYRYDLETSLFCPAPARQCSDPSDDAIWLSGKDSAGSWPNPNDQGSLYIVDFVGRRTAARGYHGHLGAYPYEVVVDRLIAIRRIEGPWKLQCDAKSNSCTQVR